MKTQNSPCAGARPHPAFTLIELLIVISVMAILAAMVFPAMGRIQKQKILKRATTELAEIETGIGAYQLKLGHYPPDNRAIPFQNQLYYELVGTKLDATGTYTTLDGVAQVATANLAALFGTSGFVNSNKGASGDEGPSAQKFFALTQGKSLLVTNSSGPFMALGSMLKGPIMLQTPDGTGRTLNPWRYISTGATNNPNSYDLWLDVNVGKTVYRISNWSKQAIIVP